MLFRSEGIRSKSWDEFAADGAPRMDFVFTVCDNAASEVCPVWPGQPVTAHWGVPDPSNAEGGDEAKRRAFAETWRILATRIRLFTNLPLATRNVFDLVQLTPGVISVAGAFGPTLAFAGTPSSQANTTRDGTIHFRDDVYGHDEPPARSVVASLAKPAPPVQTAARASGFVVQSADSRPVMLGLKQVSFLDSQ